MEILEKKKREKGTEKNTWNNNDKKFPQIDVKQHSTDPGGSADTRCQAG